MRKDENFNLLRFLKEDVIGTENTFYAWVVLVAVMAIIAMGFVVSSPKISFQGIAGSRESNVNFDYAVEVLKVHVNPGQHVSKGELLLELHAEGKGKHYIFADVDGVVGSVNFSKGEKAPAFSALVTISPGSPTFVQGFVHEALNSDLHVGSPVTVASVTGKAVQVRGRVAGLGSRFVQMPERLNGQGKIAYGREVLVEIESRNQLLLGERVLISPTTYWLQSYVASAAPTPTEFQTALDMSRPLPVKVAPGLARRAHPELSGAVYLDDLKRYLVVSDDSGEKNPPWLFLLTEDGEIEEKPLMIPGLAKLKDGESLSSEGAYTYVMSSLWAKGHERKKSGSQFIRMKRKGLELSETAAVDFAKILRDLLLASRDPVVMELMRHKERPVEVEAHAVLHGDVYVALKAPLLDNDDSVILRIRDVNKLFEKNGKESSLEVWRKLRFTEEKHRISDMTFVNGTLYLTTTRKKLDGGAFWSMSQGEPAPKLLRTFGELRPEGLAYNSMKNQFLLAFDGGGEIESHYLLIAGPRSERGHE